MNSRTRFLITTAFVCHLLLNPSLVTSQLLTPAANSSLNEEEVTIRALEQEKEGAVFKLRGQVEIRYSTYILYADQVVYNSGSGDITADGHVVLDGGPNDEHIEAAHATYNVRTQIGRFEKVKGSTGVRLHGRQVILTSSNPFTFTGKVVEKTGPDHFVVEGGAVTTCELPRPKWEFRAHKVDVDVKGDAKIYRSAFFIEGVPVFYFPFATHPVAHEERQSGFLIPNIGRSSRKGNIFGESVYWAIDRTMDLTVGAEYYSMRGWAQNGEFRARPSSTSYVDLDYFGVLDRGFGPDKVDQGGENARLKAEALLPHNIRAVANIDYLSNFVFRLAFNEVFSQAVYSEVKSEAFLSNTTNGFSYNAQAQRYQNFESTAKGDVITILHAPGLNVSSVDRPLGHLPLYWSFDVAAEGLSRSEPSFRTANLVGRLDLNPSLSMPLQWQGWSLRPQLTLHNTFYTQELQPSNGLGTASDHSIDRKAFEAAVELRPPSLDRIFDREVFGRKWKHVFEPRVTYRYVTGVDDFASILRFDARDILSDTNEVEYAIVNRLYAKRTSTQTEDCRAGMPSLIIGGQTPPTGVPWEKQEESEQTCVTEPAVREMVTWELAQKYFIDPTFGGALAPGRRNVFTTTADFSGIAFLTDERRLSPIISRLRVQTTARTDAEWDLDYDIKKGRINASTALVNYHIGEFTIGGGDAYMQVPGEITTLQTTATPQRFNQFRVLLGYGHPNKRGFSSAANFGFDSNLEFLQYSAAQISYNWDCCGINLEYRRFALGSVRNENQFRFSFALANIGSFGNLRRQEKLF
jgi:LPS-assembly protein